MATPRYKPLGMRTDVSAVPRSPVLHLFRNTLAVMTDKTYLVGRKKVRLSDLMNERWTLSPPDSFLGRIVVDVFRRRKLELPRTVVTTVSLYRRLGRLASGRFLTVLPTTMLR